MSPTTEPKSKWILILGALGFAAGFFGPIVLQPESNQGPLVGILITGPLGLCLGALGFFVSRVFGISISKQWLALKVIGVSLVSATLFFTLPGPRLRGDILKIEVVRCQKVSVATDEILKYWNERIAKVSWKAPREGWREETSETLRKAQGVVVEAKILIEYSLKEHRKPWSRGSFFVSRSERSEEFRSFYFTADSKSTSDRCVEFEAGKTRDIFITRDLAIVPPADWPPKNIPEILPFTEPKDVPAEYQNLY